ncbi:Ubiquitin carboxyl-terminal hydrolase 23 [Linum perenne]
MDSLVVTQQRRDSVAIGKDGSSSSLTITTTTSMQRKVEFHPARKQYSGVTRDFPIEKLNPDSSKRMKLEDRKAVNRGGDGTVDFLESEISSFDITFQRIGAGLRNIGNTCFLNSVLQCLTYTEPLAAYLQTGKHKSTCRIAGFCALCAIQKHVSRALRSTGMSFVPDLVSNMRSVSRTLKVSKQEDAHEYLVTLLESMHKCCLPSGVPSESPVAYEKSLVHKIFGGHLRSQVQCQQCSYGSDKFDPFLDLSLEINKADALPTALRNFTAAELLDGGEKHYQCQRCKQKVRAKKRLTVHNPPYVLSIHLKRFSAFDPGRKIEKKVSYERSLDIRPFVSNPNDCNLRYSLYGVLVHHGSSTRCGHYVCFVRTSSGMWYCLDDERVHQVSEKTVLNQKAYMLFYVRDRKTVAPRKQFDEVKNENMKPAVGGNIPNMAAKQMPNGVSTGNKKGLLEVGAPPKGVSAEQNNEPVKPQCSIQKAHPVSASSPEEQLIPKHDLRECLTISAPSVTAIVSPPKPKDCTEPRAAGTSVSGGASSSSTDEQNMATDKLACDKSSQKTSSDVIVGAEVPSGCSGNMIPKASGLTTSVGVEGQVTQVDHGQSLTNLSSQKNQEGGIPANNNNTVDQAAHKAEVVDNQSLKSEATSFVLNECQPQSTLDSPQKRAKKKLLKYPIYKLHFGTNVFRTSIVHHGIKKKNTKRKKHGRSHSSKLPKQQSDKNKSISSDEPSTSKKYTPPVSSADSRKKRAKPHGNEECGAVNAQDVAGELSQRSKPNGAVLATAERLRESSVSTLASDRKDANSTANRKRDRAHNGAAKSFAHCSKEVTASWWDEVNPAQTRKSIYAENVNIIGYVGDEWDEEYDQGKRKKIRQSNVNFGGRNLFQQVALEKSRQHNEPKVDGNWRRQKEKRRQK